MKTLKKNLGWLPSFFFRPVDAANVGTFRILFGFIMLVEAFRYHRLIPTWFAPERFHFTFSFFPFVQPWPGIGMDIHFVVLGLTAIGIMLGGILYRLSAIIFFFAFSYMFLIEKAMYLNHFYFVILLSFVLMFIDDKHHWGVFSFLRHKKIKKSHENPATVPFWNLFILRFFIVLVYFYGGIAKITPDWLRGQPLTRWMNEKIITPLSSFITFIDKDFWGYFFSYSGLLFDLSIGFLILYKRTRIIGFISVLAFNLMNHYNFNIGIFPWVMMASLILFVESTTIRNVINKIFNVFPKKSYLAKLKLSQPKIIKNFKLNWGTREKVVISLLFLLMATQMLLPFRHVFYEGSPHWTHEGHNFSWHMKLNSKRGRVIFLVKNDTDEEGYLYNYLNDLNIKQIRKMSTRPKMILQFAHYIRDNLKAQGYKNPEIYAFNPISLNGRPFQFLVDYNVNLANAKDSLWKSSDWILKLEEDLPIGNYLSGKEYRQTINQLITLAMEDHLISRL